MLSVLADSTGTEKGTTGNPLSVTFPAAQATTSTQLGEVQATPTANTVLDRLKTLNTTLGTPLQAGGTVTANVGTTNGLALDATIGVVTANPAANTVLDRLKTLNTTLGTPMQTSGGTVTVVPNSTGGWTPVLANDLSTTVTTIIGAPATLGYYFCWNPNAAVSFIQIFDTAGTVTLGTTAPKISLGLPPTSSGNLEWTAGVHFAAAIKVAATTTVNGAVAPSSPTQCNFGYK